jgi:hypothetical protein
MTIRVIADEYWARTFGVRVGTPLEATYRGVDRDWSGDEHHISVWFAPAGRYPNGLYASVQATLVPTHTVMIYGDRHHGTLAQTTRR